MIHHCQWMYDNAWWVKKYFPDVKIVDSLHIVEYMFQGGFPRESLAHDEWIDLHHVISPQLERWMEDIHHIPASKVVDAPLVGLTADSEHVSYAERRDPRVFNVAFVGRMSRQKRPDAFILVARPRPANTISSCTAVVIWTASPMGSSNAMALMMSSNAVP